ncbi:hypothetical protein JCM10207_008747 [Rhodosporidiobolus poonsookiae]
MSGYPQGQQHYNTAYDHSTYPQDNLYSNQPYAFPPSPAANDYPEPHYPYSSQDYISPERDGAGVPGGRQATYPPEREDAESLKYGAFGYEKTAGTVPVTRGSIAAQMAAEGQIPKKEGLRMWRKDEHAGALTRGGRARCCGRVFCCCLILVILIVVGIVAAFFLWVKPPDVGFEGIEDPSSGSIVSVASGGFNLNFRLKINVINPNFFGAKFNKIDATAYYPLRKDTAFGGGSLTNVEIKKNSNSTVHFPFAVNYTTSYDPDLTVIKDIAEKCGFTGSTKSQLTVNYKVKTSVKVIAITVSPSFSSSASFDCPLSEDDITGFLGSDALSSLGLSGLLGSSSRLRERALDERDERDDGDVASQVGRAASHALAKLAARGMEEVFSEQKREKRTPEHNGVFDPSRLYKIGTVVLPA